uniref:Uncharacterized protein n=3 Tax=Neisseria meningitidis TaxID=487 RepID=C6SH69_NEIME|nr:hypothetical protein predicted by Glimmer/Critica [Neisseria meningitidis alpha275]CBA07863.1 hypothetical protein predicted by Glimmer/Critica [Neisseria meningitidis alpha153]CCA44041.1 hypothetical protein NMALPHA522_0500 [Neisseria meningitidis alpha522]
MIFCFSDNAVTLKRESGNPIRWDFATSNQSAN